jgi:Zn-dependent peptidase ImmA (M78 family)
MSANYTKAKSSAEEVLKENYITHPPVPVMELVKNYGYKVVEVELDNDIAGFVNPASHVIYINIQDSPTRKAFTVAHELGHIKLHAAELESNPELGILYRRPLGKKDTDEKEQEANCFAANLLVPQEMLEEITAKYKDVLPEDNGVSLLSAIFGVSRDVIGFRKHDLAI